MLVTKVPSSSETMAQVQVLTLSVLGKQMAVLGLHHLSLITACVSLAEAGVTSGQTRVVILGVQQSRWRLHPTGCHCLALADAEHCVQHSLPLGTAGHWLSCCC